MKNLINIPKNDMNKYAYNILNNKIKYVMVKDDKIDMSSVCVTVKTGSIQEPKEYQGLAHFLEHMLFLGSKKFPKESHFDDRLKKCGGHSNAWTADFETVYYFTVQTEYLEEMVSIFSRFFIDPLFDPDSVNREMNAVDSEHKKNINNDWWRIYRMFDLISKKDSPINKFGTGNLETLNKKGLRDRMIKFYNDFYCSENISLAVISSINLEKQNKIIKKYFGEIKHKKPKNFIINQPFYHKNNKSYHIQSVSKMKTMIFLWEIPTFHNDIEYKSWNIITDFINDNGLESLESFLKSKGLIEDLFIFPRNHGILMLAVDLLKNNKKYRQDVSNYINYYIKTLLDQNWEKISTYFQKNGELIYHNNPRMNPLGLIQNLANNCHYLDMEDVRSWSLIKKIDGNRIKNLLKKYINNNYIEILVSDKKENIKYKKEKYYGIKYGFLEPLSKDEKKLKYNFNLNNPYHSISPTNIKISKKMEIPKKENNIWYGATSQFNEPKIYCILQFSSYNYFNSVKKYLINDITIKSIEYYFSRKFNQENKLGYYCDFKLNLLEGALYLYITGNNDKYNLFFKNSINYIQNIELDNYVIKSIIKETKDNISNSDKIPSWEYSNILVDEYCIKYDYTKDQLSQGLKEIKINDIKTHTKNILNGHLVPFFYGNFKKKDLPNMDIFEKNMNKKIHKLYKIKKIKSMKIKHPYKKENNNCVSIYYPCGKDSYFNQIRKYMLNLIIDQPFFAKLRTKDQLGYRVGFYSKTIRDDIYLIAKVQSEKDTKHILDRMKIFFDEFNDILLNMDNKTWNNWKKTVEKNLKKRYESTNSLFSKFSNDIFNRKCRFNSREMLMKELKSLKLSHIQEYYQKNVLNSKKKKIIQVLKRT